MKKILLFSIIILALVVGSLLFLDSSDEEFPVEDIDFLFDDVDTFQYLPDEIDRNFVLAAFNESEAIIEEMQENEFSIVYMNDILLESRRTFSRVEKAEILRGNVNASKEEIDDANRSLNLIDWKNIDYYDAWELLEVIRIRKVEAFNIYDAIVMTEMNLDTYEESFDVSDAREFLDRARIAFYDDRYDEAKDFIRRSRDDLDSKRSEIFILGDLARNTRNFIQNYWIYLLLFLAVLIFLLLYVIRIIRIRNLKKNILRMETEEKVLNDLIIKAQTERFKDNKISNLTYKIRIDKYNEKLGYIKENLPVLKSNLKKISKKSLYTKRYVKK